MKFEHKKPFRTYNGEVVTMKSLYNIYGVQSVEVYENKKRFKPDELTLMSADEYEAYLASIAKEEDNEPA